MTAELLRIEGDAALSVESTARSPLDRKNQFASIVYEMGLQEEAEDLVRDIRAEVLSLVAPVDGDARNRNRAVHSHARETALEKHRTWIERRWRDLHDVFAEPRDLDPKKLRPRLILAETQRHRDIFRLARLTWSLAYSGGYGRRLSYLIWDDTHNKLMGVLGLQSPPLSFPARDKKYAIPFEVKPTLVNQTMDAYVVGAVPPYNAFHGGKLAVLAAASLDVRRDYQSRYADRVAEMSQSVIPAHLVAVTTLAAFGRSSMYGRVSKGIVDGRVRLAAESLGPCVGWGTAQFSGDLYEKMKDFHRLIEPTRETHGFGTGPKIKQQIVKRVLRTLRLPDGFVRHDIKREVYIISHITNLVEFLGGTEGSPTYDDEPFESLAEHWVHRYCIPRSETRCPIEGSTAVAKALKVSV